jgi:hypothetical protein
MTKSKNGVPLRTTVHEKHRAQRLVYPWGFTGDGGEHRHLETFHHQHSRRSSKKRALLDSNGNISRCNSIYSFTPSVKAPTMAVSRRCLASASTTKTIRSQPQQQLASTSASELIRARKTDYFKRSHGDRQCRKEGGE